MPAWAFHLLNLTFISHYQSILLFLLAAPAYLLLLAPQFEKDLTVADAAFVAVGLGLLLVEWFSDQQMWGRLTITRRVCVRGINIGQITKRPRGNTRRRPKSLGDTRRSG